MGLQKVAVLGAGSWGTALAKLLAEKGYATSLWARRTEQAEDIQKRRENVAYLPGFELPPNIEATADLRYAVRDAYMIVCVVPMHGLRSVLEQARNELKHGAFFVSATKGIENTTLKLVCQIVEEHVPSEFHSRLMYLSGPTFAREVAAGVPTATSLAGHDEALTCGVQDAMATERFKVYTTDDVVGVEVGGALKNVIAIAAGIADGLGFGHNTRAALITRGLAEIGRLALKLGANPLTLAGLSGMGDLVLTCTGDLSRNRAVGLELGRGRPLSAVLAGMTMVAEGVGTARSAHALAIREDVEMPIVREVYNVLYEGTPPLEAVVSLMMRPTRAERE